MARPSNSVGTIKKNMTKSEKEQREEAEKAALSGIEIRMSISVKRDRVAREEFERVIEILTAVGKNDALYEAVINDYCTYKSDIERYSKYRKAAEKDIRDLKKIEMPDLEKFDIKIALLKTIGSYDKQIQTYQRKRFEIEKETGFTVVSALRSIPKKTSKKTNPLEELLKGD